MALPSSILKLAIPTTWFVFTQAEVEPHQKIKLDQKNLGTSMS